MRVFYARFSNYNMEMWRYASELKQPLPYKKLPFHHFPNRQGDYYGVNIRTNSLGFRDYEYAVEKPKDVKRIVFLGDSFTLGWGVALKDLFSKQLEQMLKEKGNFEVINMGTGNYNSTMQVELFKLKGLKLNPDLVILVYFVNDVEPTPKNLSAFSYFMKSHSYFFAFLFDRHIKLRLKFDRGFNWEQYYQKIYSDPVLTANQSASIKELSALCRRKGIKLLLVSLPELHILEKYPFSFATEHIKKLAEEADVAFLDLLDALIGYEPASLWVSSEDFHANARANSIIAQAIYRKIMNERLVR